uniref:PRA1 family protein n=1 Tax=Mesocestoides corti TaxID=53468 RepID=A0A5K3EJE0_MESCO
MRRPHQRIPHDPLLSHDEKSNQSKKKTSCCAFTPSWIKTFLIFFTLIIMVMFLDSFMVQAIALAFIGLGAYFTVTRNSYLPMLLGELAYINNYLLIGIGILLSVVCIFGLVAISNNDPAVLKVVILHIGRVKPVTICL